MRLIINQAASLLHTDSNLSETEVLTSTIKQHFSPQLTHPREMEQREEIEEPVNTSYELASWNKLNQLLAMYFDDNNEVVDTESALTELTDAVKTQLKEQRLQSLPSLINKVKTILIIELNVHVLYMCSGKFLWGFISLFFCYGEPQSEKLTPENLDSRLL